MSSRPEPTIVLGDDAVERLAGFCAERGFANFLLVADQNTYPVLGEAVERTLQDRGSSVSRLILEGYPLLPDEQAVSQILEACGGRQTVLLAVGSGTITDLVRYTSHSTLNVYLSVPTAPSMDGFVSAHAPLIFKGFKQTIPARPPLAVFAHLPTLCKAPKEMIAAGFGDLLGKFTSLADWKLGRLLWDEHYSEEIAAQTGLALQGAVNQIDAIAEASPSGIRGLTEALLNSGLSMLRAGGSWPASGSEHHISHFWEMRLLREGRPPLLHGAKVGVAACLIAGIYTRIGRLSKARAAALLKRASRSDADETIRALHAVYGSITDQVIATQREFLAMDEDAWLRHRQKILAEWAAVRSIAAGVPSARQLKAWLKQAGGAAKPQDLGLSEAEVAVALGHADALRNRYTVLKLKKFLQGEGDI